MKSAQATQPKPPDEPNPYVPRPIPDPDEPPAPSTPEWYVPEGPSPNPQPIHPAIPDEPIHPPRATQR
jgi:hypothetical protein